MNRVHIKTSYFFLSLVVWFLSHIIQVPSTPQGWVNALQQMLSQIIDYLSGSLGIQTLPQWCFLFNSPVTGEWHKLLKISFNDSDVLWHWQHHSNFMRRATVPMYHWKMIFHLYIWHVIWLLLMMTINYSVNYTLVHITSGTARLPEDLSGSKIFIIPSPHLFIILLPRHDGGVNRKPLSKFTFFC